MKKLVLLLFVLFVGAAFILPSVSKEGGLSMEKKDELIKKLENSTLIIYKNGSEEAYTERGLIPLLNYIEKNDLKGAYAFDRTIGRAAAYLYAYSDCDYVYADTISKPAIEILKANNIK